MIDAPHVDEATGWLCDFYGVQGLTISHDAIRAVLASLEITNDAREELGAFLALVRKVGWSEHQADSFVNGFLVGVRAAQNAAQVAA